TEARLPDEPRLSPAQATDLPDDALLYLDDSAGLNNRDWSPDARKKTLDQAIDGGGVALYVVEQADPALRLGADRVTARPGPAKPIGLRATPQSHAVPASFGPPPPNGGSGGPTWLNDDDDDDDDQVIVPDDCAGKRAGPAKSKKCRSVYLLKKVGARP